MEKEEKRADQENDTEEQSTEAKSLLKKKLQYYSSEIQRDVGNLVKWLMIAVLVGCITGAASTLFSFVLKSVTNCRKENEWMFYLLPVMGLIIVYLYEKFGKDDGGTNQVLSTVRSQDDVPILSAPLIFISTALTHLAGGSAGREGAAIQLGGSIANQLGRWIHLDEEDRHVIVMCGMSAAFSALFGTPMAAAVFALEVVSVGVMYYTALMPCMIASLVASGFAAGMGVTPETFHVVDIPKLTIETGLKMGAIAVGCAVISIVFCMVLNGVAGAYGRWFKNPYVRVVVGSCLVIGITLLLGTSDYMGAGAELIEKAVEEGRFRRDLYHRLKEFVIKIPPLRECRGDILPLAEFFRELANEELGRHTEGFDKEAEKELMRRMWAGNVRELKQTVRSAVLLTEGRLIGADRLEAESTAQAGSSLLLKDGNEERERIVRALAQADGNREMAAGLLGISRTTLYNKMKEYGIMQKKSEK